MKIYLSLFLSLFILAGCGTSTTKSSLITGGSVPTSISDSVATANSDVQLYQNEMGDYYIIYYTTNDVTYIGTNDNHKKRLTFEIEESPLHNGTRTQHVIEFHTTTIPKEINLTVNGTPRHFDTIGFFK